MDGTGESTARPTRDPLKLLIVVLVGILVAAATIGGILAWTFLSPQQETPEQAYVSDLRALTGQASSSLNRYSEALGGFLNGALARTEAVEAIADEAAEMESIRNTAAALVPPCDAYALVHAATVSAYENFTQAFAWTAMALETGSTASLNTALGFLDAGNESIDVASDALALLSETAPNC